MDANFTVNADPDPGARKQIKITGHSPFDI
jgi:hypothetical protein